MSKLAINFNHDTELIGEILPTLENITNEVRYLLETIISNDEELYQEKWGHSLVHTERDRLVKYMSEYLLSPLEKALKRTYIYSGTPESRQAILEDLRSRIESDEVISNIEVDFQGLEFCCSVEEKGKFTDVSMTADELIDDTALHFLQSKLTILYKRSVELLMKAIDRIITRCGFDRRPRADVRVYHF